MITYEEFLKKNNIQELNTLSFRQEETMSVDAIIEENPREYVDVAKDAKELKYIIVGETQTAEFYENLRTFVENCNEEIKVLNGIAGGANKTEYLKGEEKIQEILAEINPEWSTKQKLAYTHYKIGETISYIPDFNFSGRYVNSKISQNSRNIWKSICDGKSVCNGIVDIQRNILSRLGIKTKELSSETHSFLLTETEEGNIITDPTWDLSNTLYQARPQYFGITYEELRKREDGLSNAHKLEESPENIIEISEQELRELYYSIGMANEDRTFVFPILEEVETINAKEYSTLSEKIDDFFSIFSEKFSKESSHLSETRTILESAISELGVKREQIRTRFVYSKDDESSQEPYLIVHINSDDLKSKIRILNTKETNFKNIDLKEFDRNYKLHDLDTTEPFWQKYIKQTENNLQNEKCNDYEK